MIFLLLHSPTKQAHREDHYQYCGCYETKAEAEEEIKKFKPFGYKRKDFVICQKLT